ncbi:hypothetical protein A9W99_23895 [Mycobacterium sp. 1164966.3]|nr:hypothetical protein A9W99_23895 [Mycobacterium sp. 1164966.3]
MPGNVAQYIACRQHAVSLADTLSADYTARVAYGTAEGRMFYQIVVSIIAVLALVTAVFLPIQARRIRDGWKPIRFEGTHAEFVAKYRGQARLYWINLVLGVLLTAGGLFSVFANEPGRWWRFLGGVAFVIIGAVGLWCRHILSSSPKKPMDTSEGEVA